MNQDVAKPIIGVYENGPVEISWNIDGDGYTLCELVLKFNDDVIDENTLRPDDVNWNTGKHAASNGWVDLDLRMTVPTDDQKGALRLIKLEWEEEDQGPQVVENIELVTWTPSGP